MTSKELLRELGELDADLVLKISLEEDVVKRCRMRQVYKKLIACAAAFALVFGIFSIVGFDNVDATVRQWLSFIPGFGIQTADKQSICIHVPIAGKIESADADAEILRAAYCDGILTITVYIDGKTIYGKDFCLYVNGKRWDVGDNYSLAVASGPAVGYESAILDIAAPMEVPKADDRFEVEIAGFADRLAFSMKHCQNYADLCEIGPTVTKNGITLTVTANRIGNELVIWCYETRDAGSTNDQVLGYGSPVNGAHVLLRYLETEGGIVPETTSGLSLRNRFVFQISESDTNAVLHIPYLAMFRKVQEKLKISLPAEPGSAATDDRVTTDIGSICVTAVERSTYEHDNSKDKVMLQLGYENNALQQQIYSLDYDVQGNHISAIIPDGKTGTTKYIEVIVDKDTATLEISIDGIYYYLMDEYAIELDIQQ